MRNSCWNVFLNAGGRESLLTVVVDIQVSGAIPWRWRLRVLMMVGVFRMKLLPCGRESALQYLISVMDILRWQDHRMSK